MTGALFIIEIETDTLGQSADECDSNVARLLMDVADQLVDANRRTLAHQVPLEHGGRSVGHWGYG